MSGAGSIVIGLLVGCAAAAAATRVPRRSRDRSRRLNEALHELRRPLQALALSPAPPGSEQWIAQAGRALAELEATVNGPRAPMPIRRRGAVELGELIDAARTRWAGAAGLRFELEAPPQTTIVGDQVELGAALDNLIANALEHGRGPVTVRGLTSSGAARVQVANRPRSPSAEATSSRRDRTMAADPRHGHGLRRAARIAGEHGGILLPPRLGRGGVLTELQLPAAVRGER